MGKLRKIQARIPVIEIIVNTIPIKNTAPNATGILICCVRTILKVINAVRETAQPMAIGKLAHNPISREPNPATKQVPTKAVFG